MRQSPDQPDAKPGKSSPGFGRFEDEMLALLPQLRRYSRSLTRSDTDSEDLLQDCVETALSRRGQWRGVNLKAWALAIMTNLYRNNHRFTRRHPEVDIEEAGNLADPTAADDPLERDRLKNALDALSAEYRAVLMLVVLEGYSYQEVAELLGVPPGTVMSRLSRARERLRETLAQSNIISLRRPR